MTRTTCACKECVDCCKRQPGSLAPGDLERIAAARGETLDEAKKNFWASPGAVVKNSETGRTFRVGSITPRFDRRRGRCVFLTDDDRCSIHAVAPFGCAFFSPHMDFDQGHGRSAIMVRQMMKPEYQQLRDSLPLADHYKPTRHH